MEAVGLLSSSGCGHSGFAAMALSSGASRLLSPAPLCSSGQRGVPLPCRWRRGGVKDVRAGRAVEVGHMGRHCGGGGWWCRSFTEEGAAAGRKGVEDARGRSSAVGGRASHYALQRRYCTVLHSQVMDYFS